MWRHHLLAAGPCPACFPSSSGCQGQRSFQGLEALDRNLRGLAFRILYFLFPSSGMLVP